MRPWTDREIRRPGYNFKAGAVAGFSLTFLIVSGGVAYNLILGDVESPLMMVLSATAVVALMAILLWIRLRQPD